MLKQILKHKHVAILDGWRGLAVALVIIGHFGADFHFPWLSTLGVDLFFVLSGRLMAEILFVRKTPLPDFFARRFSRIFPTMAIFVAVMALATYGTTLWSGYIGIAAAFTFTINYVIALRGSFVPVLDHLWSLCVEEHSYILLGFVAYRYRERAPRFAVAIIALVGLLALTNGIIQSDVFGRDFFSVFWRTDVAAAPIFIAAAMFLALGRYRDRPIVASVAPIALMLGIAARLLAEDAFVFFGFKAILLAFAVSAIEYSGRLTRIIFEMPILRQLGQWSFSLYLWQQPFYKMVGSEMLPLWGALPLALLCGVTSFYLIERPTRSGLNRLIARQSGATGLLSKSRSTVSDGLQRPVDDLA